MDYLKYILIGAILIVLTSCKGKNRLLDKKYEGYWMDTGWTYEFRDNGQFIFKSMGHYGNVVDSGFYFLQDSLIFLNPRTDWHVFDGVLKTRLKIINANCIRDFDSNYYCDAVEEKDKFNETELAFQERVKGIVDTLQVVKDEKERVSSYHPDKEELDFEIIYDGIIVIDNKEFHAFSLARYDRIDGRQSYLTLLATKNPFKIFQHDIAGDKISLIYKK